MMMTTTKQLFLYSGLWLVVRMTAEQGIVIHGGDCAVTQFYAPYGLDGNASELTGVLNLGLTPYQNSAAAQVNDIVYITGGSKKLNCPVSDVQTYNLITGVTNSKYDSMPYGRTQHSAAALNGKIYVCGGLGCNGAMGLYEGIIYDTCSIYDTIFNRWSEMKQEMPSNIYGHGSFGLGGTLYIIGTPGLQGDSAAPVVLWYYQSETWYGAANVTSTVIGYYFSTYVDNSLVTICGGASPLNPSGTALCELLNVPSGNWSSAPLMKARRYGHAMVSVSSAVYIFGGIRLDGYDTDSIEMYNSSIPVSSKLHVPCAHFVAFAAELDIHTTPNNNHLKIVLSVFGGIGILMLLIVALLWWRKQKTKQYAKTRYDMWECHRDEIDFGNGSPSILGEGVGGVVHKALLKPKERKTDAVVTQGGSVQPSLRGLFNKTEVAVKTLRTEATLDEKGKFFAEIAAMRRLAQDVGFHAHIVNALCYVTQSAPYYLVMELCSEGSLLGLLRRRPRHSPRPGYTPPSCVESCLTTTDNIRDNSSGEQSLLTHDELLQFAEDVVDAMEYIASCGYVHRDLSARNVLINKVCFNADTNESKLIAKVGDFGMARRVHELDPKYQGSMSSPVPVFWTAIEGLRDAKFTTASDVWSFGVLMFEMMSRGEEPYAHVDVLQLLLYLESGQRQPAPSGCPPEIYDVMLSCWQAEPTDRPSWHQLLSAIRALMSNGDLSNGYIEPHLMMRSVSTSSDSNCDSTGTRASDSCVEIQSLSASDLARQRGYYNNFIINKA